MNKYPVAAFLLFCCLLQSVLHAQNFDINLLEPINKNETSFKNNYSKFSTSSVKLLSLGIPAGIAIAGFINNDKQLQRDALYMGGAFVANTIVTQVTKRIINRQRPFEKHPFIIKRDDQNAGLSFPSGHTSSVFCTATSVALRYRKWYFVAPSYLFATSVAWARMYQGVHYPSDVFAGAVIGAGSAWLGYKVQRWMERKHKVHTIINQRW